VPIINGKRQPTGAEFTARNIPYKANNATVPFSENIARAYPESADVTTWQRTIRLNRSKNVQMQDNLQLKKATTIPGIC
jgi:hypothetical protein